MWNTVFLSLAFCSAHLAEEYDCFFPQMVCGPQSGGHFASIDECEAACSVGGQAAAPIPTASPYEPPAVAPAAPVIRNVEECASDCCELEKCTASLPFSCAAQCCQSSLIEEATCKICLKDRCLSAPLNPAVVPKLAKQVPAEPESAKYHQISDFNFISAELPTLQPSLSSMFPSSHPSESPTVEETASPTTHPTTHPKVEEKAAAKKASEKSANNIGDVGAPKAKGSKHVSNILAAEVTPSAAPGGKKEPAKRKNVGNTNIGAKSFGELVAEVSPAFLVAVVLIIAILICSCCYSCEVGSRGVEPNEYFNGGQRMARIGLPIFFVGYYCTLVLPPILYGTVLRDDSANDDDCGATIIRWEAHAFAGVAIFAAMAMDFVTAYTLDVRQNMPYFPDFGMHILKNWPMLVIMTGFSRLDTYLDICFVCIAFHCHSALWAPAAGVLGLSVFITQFAPAALGAFGAAPEGFKTVCKWMEMQLSAEIMWIKAVQEDKLFFDEEKADNAVMLFYGTSFGRLIMQDLPMIIMQLVFLVHNPHSTVVASVVVAIILSIDTAVKWCDANGKAAEIADGVRKSPRSSPRNSAQQTPTQLSMGFDPFNGSFGAGFNRPCGSGSPGRRGGREGGRGKSNFNPEPGLSIGSNTSTTSSVLHNNRSLIRASQDLNGFL